MRNDRWATEKEIKKALDPGETAGGPTLYSVNGVNYKDTGDAHSIILGSTGSGKTKTASESLIRSLQQAQESMIVVDPKGDLYRNTAGYFPEQYQLHVMDMRHIACSERFSPLSYPWQLFHSGDFEKKENAIDWIDSLAHTIYPVSKNEDPFWQLASRNLFRAVSCALLELAKPDEVNFLSIAHFVANGDARFGGSTYLREFLEMNADKPFIYTKLSEYVNAPSDTKASISTVFMDGINKYTKSEGILSLLSANDFTMDDLDGEKPCAIFLIIPDETEVYNDLCTILLGQFMEYYIHLAEDKYEGKLPRRVNLLVEEAGSVKVPQLSHLLSAARSRNIRLHLVLQNLQQLSNLYGDHEASTIMENTGLWFVFRTNNFDTLEEFSRKCGERDIVLGNRITRERLISPTQLGAMEIGQALVICKGHLKFITWLPIIEEMYPCDGRKAPVREKRKEFRTPPVFDIKEFVKEYKKQKLLEMMNSDERVRPDPDRKHSSSVSGPRSGIRPQVDKTAKDRAVSDNDLDEIRNRISFRLEQKLDEMARKMIREEESEDDNNE